MNAKTLRSIGVALSALALTAFLCSSTDAGRGGGKGGSKGGGGGSGQAHGGASGRGGGHGGGGVSQSSFGGMHAGGGQKAGGSASHVSRPHGDGSAGHKGGIGSLGTRPVKQPSSRPATKGPASRPDLGLHPGAAQTRPSTRPDIAQQPAAQIRPGDGIAARPSLPDFNQRPTARPAVRPGAGDTIAARPGVVQPRPQVQSDRIRPEARPDRGPIVAARDRTDINRIVGKNHWEHNHQTNIHNSPTIIKNGYRPGIAWGGRGYGYRGDWGYGRRHFHDDSWYYGPGWRPAYFGYHGGWYHGSCSHDLNWGSYAAGVLTGVATSWALGSRTYVWGYSSYNNPYYTPAVQTVIVQRSPTLVYNYQQPINTEAPPPSAEVTQPALTQFEEARVMFRVGDYPQALSLTDQALASMPNDATMHEFRALVLFALNRYDEASAVLYSVLSVGPGWDWTTLAGLYDNIDTYTQQLRTLESYRRQHADESAPTFLLAYHYLTAGYKEEAADLYEAVVKLQPGDTLSQGLLSALRPPAAQPATPAPPAPGTSDTIDAARLVGNWRATADQDTTIALSLQRDGKFTWDVVRGAQTQRIEGTYTLEDDVLTLAQPEGEGGAMAGAVTLQGGGGFRFRAIGAPPEDQGLAFAK